jgi:hypothetical protein
MINMGSVGSGVLPTAAEYLAFSTKEKNADQQELWVRKISLSIVSGCVLTLFLLTRRKSWPGFIPAVR